LPKPSKSTSPQTKTINGPIIDPDSKLAHALQPLLKQEALLESFIEEAKTHRKFEDAKSLKSNLFEIQAEIDKIVANGHEGGRLMIPQLDGKSKKSTG
jgi:rabenosyn-5